MTKLLRRIKNVSPNQIIFIAGAASVALGVLLIFLNHFQTSANSEAEGFVSTPLVAATTSPIPTLTTEIVVDIGGAVKEPGIYRLIAGSRLYELIDLAGGFQEKAVDKHYLARELNLALTLEDGQKYYLPFKGETITAPTSQGSSTDGSSSSNKISLNQATLKQLITLPGIGEVRGQQIIAGRPYENVDDLVKREVISDKVYQGLKDQVEI